MYNIKFIDDLPYDYDEEYIDIDHLYKINHVYYSINTMLVKPYIEILLDGELNFLNSTCEEHMISPKNLSSHVYSGVNAHDIDCRFQGYHCCNKLGIFLFYRISATCERHYNNPYIHIATIYDILNMGKMHNNLIHNDVIKYFKTVSNKMLVFNITNREYIHDIPETIYSVIEKNQTCIDYIVQYKTMYFMNNKLLLDLVNVNSCENAELCENVNSCENAESCEKMMVRNIVFDKENIISFKQLFSFIENNYIVS